MSGQFAINLQFSPVDLGLSGDDEKQGSIFQALREQAGLKLESTTAPVEVLVIDRTVKPEPN